MPIWGMSFSHVTNSTGLMLILVFTSLFCSYTFTCLFFLFGYETLLLLILCPLSHRYCIVILVAQSMSVEWMRESKSEIEAWYVQVHVSPTDKEGKGSFSLSWFCWACMWVFTRFTRKCLLQQGFLGSARVGAWHWQRTVLTLGSLGIWCPEAQENWGLVWFLCLPRPVWGDRETGFPVCPNTHQPLES